jgi:hypothetical protein
VTATQRFYLGFFIALALVIGASYAAGYHAGTSHAMRSSHDLRAARPAP